MVVGSEQYPLLSLRRTRTALKHPYAGDVVKGATVMLLFTVKRGKLADGVVTARGMSSIQSGIYPNVLVIVVLAEPSKPFSQVPSQEEPVAFGVDSIRELEESESEAGDDPFL